MDKDKLIHRRADEARIFLVCHGFITAIENDKIKKRIAIGRSNLEKPKPKKKVG